ncbi:MAG: hypothetical protein D6720_03455 [Gammaproteobacteria bacterium]|nr:MAG: hypothetical protein D6720_03455 [Gammaproteobacteria bacterium]
MYNGSPTIDFALARWELSETDDHQATLSIGRHKNPIGLYNATRDVAHTRPSVFVPQSVYFDRVRNLLLSSDGVMLHLDHYADFGELSLDAGVGKPVLDKNVEVMLLGRDWPGDLSSGRPARLGRIRFTTPDQRWQAALSYADTQIAFDPAAGSIPGPGTTHIGYLVASLQFNQGNWTVTGEYMLEPASAKGFGAPFDNEVTGEGYYLQLQRYVGPSLSLHVRYEEAYLDRDDRNGRASALRTGLPASFFFAKSWTVGARWDVTSRLMLSADFSGNDGNYFLSSRDNPSPAALKRRWNMISILASYRF